MTILLSTVHAEWMKLRTSRSTWVTTTVAAVGAVVLSFLATKGQRSDWDTMTAQQRLEFDPTAVALVGVIVSALVIGSLAVRSVSVEYSTGMIRTTFAAM